MRTWRVGRISFGVLLLALGTILLLMKFIDLDLNTIIQHGVPTILIILGLEILIFAIFSLGYVRFSVFSVIMILVISAFAYSFNYMIEFRDFNKFDDELQDLIEDLQ